jgi:hypothetical protein
LFLIAANARTMIVPLIVLTKSSIEELRKQLSTMARVIGRDMLFPATSPE